MIFGHHPDGEVLPAAECLNSHQLAHLPASGGRLPLLGFRRLDKPLMLTNFGHEAALFT